MTRSAFALGLAATVLFQNAAHVRAQGSAPGFAPVEIGGVTVAGSLRLRVESWEWFGNNPIGTYTYPGSLFRVGFGQSKPRHEWQLELALPVLLDLPKQSAGAGPEGLGASYFTANDGRTDAAMLFVKQAFVRFTDVGGVKGQSLKFGRMELFDGAEVSPTNATLAALKRDRVASRLLANFGFTHVQRSFDGAQYAIDRPTINLTFVAARPTRGVFQVDGWGELNVNVFYGAVTGQSGDAAHAAEWRFFGLGYNDDRNGVVKTDNRPLRVRQADTGHVKIGSFGGHYLRAIETSGGMIDLLLWGAVQGGSWGALTHRAGALATEMGWQPKVVLTPWIRGGVDYGSGDHDPNDGTFFQVLPTPRLYARFPFFNMMNTEDAFGELILKPTKTLSVRGDVHALRLADANDLWYQGGGAFQPGTFGYGGQSSNGHAGLATLYDASADVAITPRVSVGLYYGRAAGGAVPQAIYGTAANAALGFVEVLLRF